jgi:hypothetical protein
MSTVNLDKEASLGKSQERVPSKTENSSLNTEFIPTLFTQIGRVFELWKNEVHDFTNVQFSYIRDMGEYVADLVVAVGVLILCILATLVLIYPEISVPILFMICFYYLIMKSIRLGECEDQINTSGFDLHNIKCRESIASLKQLKENCSLAYQKLKRNPQDKMHILQTYFNNNYDASKSEEYLAKRSSYKVGATDFIPFDSTIIEPELEQSEFFHVNRCHYSQMPLQFPIKFQKGDKVSYYEATVLFSYLEQHQKIPYYDGPESYQDLFTYLSFDHDLFVKTQEALELVFVKKTVLPIKNKIASQIQN